MRHAGDHQSVASDMSSRSAAVRLSAGRSDQEGARAAPPPPDPASSLSTLLWNRTCAPSHTAPADSARMPPLLPFAAALLRLWPGQKSLCIVYRTA